MLSFLFTVLCLLTHSADASSLAKGAMASLPLDQVNCVVMVTRTHSTKPLPGVPPKVKRDPWSKHLVVSLNFFFLMWGKFLNQYSSSWQIYFPY